MELKIDDKELAKEIAALAVERLRHYVNDNDAKYMFYHESVDKAVQKEVGEIIRENKDKILDAVVDKLADDYMKQIKLAAVLSALAKKE